MDYKRYYEQVRQRLDHLVRRSAEDDYASVSLLIGKNHAYIQQFIKRGVPKCLHENDLDYIADHFGVSPDYFGAPEDFPTPGYDFLTEAADFSADDYILVNAYDIHAAAGVGAVVEENEVENRLAFRKSWIRSSSNATSDNLAVITVAGDSMTPTLVNGDHILVDMTEKSVKNDGIFVLRSDGMVLVKRISVNPVTSLCSIKSDNSFYESWNDCDPDKLDILGRVIWVGRKI